MTSRIAWLAKWRQLGWGTRVSIAIGVLGILTTLVLQIYPAGKEAASPQPALYSVRVQVLDPTGHPVDESKLRVSVGNEPHLLPDGFWQVEIPRAKLPADGQVSVWAEHPQWETAREVLHLEADSNPPVEIRLGKPEEQIVGVVVDAAGRGVPDARVTVRGFSVPAVVTDQDGRFELTISVAQDQSVRFHVEAAGFQPKDSFCLAGGEGCSIILSLE